ncbi:MAG: hypothetical protein PQ612_04525 [Rickettsiales bacterium]|nr:hypothetical protein [Pseudomonadota bacterium]MDA0966121.1 hypothetical protein [Pseudomonadota bacterium]MDG4543214.1 hypothetical protein [Rickettsiales bacterium]MDG4545412.1 hypothetical protein [Rickettsiales bacterium]MDG4547861.1 hypothetical protein [Rickettsiales bacterium]
MKDTTKKHTYPSLEFQEQFNYKFGGKLRIASEYNPPEGYSSNEELEEECAKHREVGSSDTADKLRSLSRKIFDANPGLQQQIGDVNDKSLDILVQGVASKFNASDIKHYIGLMESSAKNPDVCSANSETSSNLSKSTGINVRWSVSPETEKAIKNEHKKALLKSDTNTKRGVAGIA